VRVCAVGGGHGDRPANLRGLPGCRNFASSNRAPNQVDVNHRADRVVISGPRSFAIEQPVLHHCGEARTVPAEALGARHVIRNAFPRDCARKLQQRFPFPHSQSQSALSEHSIPECMIRSFS